MSSSSISTPKQKGDLYLASSLCDGLEDNDLRYVIVFFFLLYLYRFQKSWDDYRFQKSWDDALTFVFILE